MAGPPDSGKSLFQNLVTEMFGGRMAKPYRYMREKSEFNGELFGAEHLMIEDEVAATDIRARRNFGARIKEITVNQTQSFHAKHRQAITLTPLWRLTISLNDEPENLLILPPIDESLADKIHLLKVRKKPMPMPTHSNTQKKAFWDALLRELPAFLWYLEQWEIPAALKCERFGITHFHHPELLSAIETLAPETRLLAMIDAELFSGPANSTWEGKAEQLERRLISGDSAHEARRLLYWDNATGTYLGRLEKKHPDRIQKDRTALKRGWKILPKTSMTP